jgi:hypothetical protein
MSVKSVPWYMLYVITVSERSRLPAYEGAAQRLIRFNANRAAVSFLLIDIKSLLLSTVEIHGPAAHILTDESISFAARKKV